MSPSLSLSLSHTHTHTHAHTGLSMPYGRILVLLLFYGLRFVCCVGSSCRNSNPEAVEGLPLWIKAGKVPLSSLLALSCVYHLLLLEGLMYPSVTKWGSEAVALLSTGPDSDSCVWSPATSCCEGCCSLFPGACPNPHAGKEVRKGKQPQG
jgi:hypothetical protein